jgi:large subunit ribosomal protein L32
MPLLPSLFLRPSSRPTPLANHYPLSAVSFLVHLLPHAINSPSPTLMSSLLRSAARAAFSLPTRTSAVPVSTRAYTVSALVHPSCSNHCDSSSSSTLSSAAASSGIATTALGRLGNYISDLIPSIVWASVPKRKTSHSKKRMRQANKGLQEQRNIVQCPGCGQAKLMHHLCTHCYRDMKGRGPLSRTDA